MAGFGDIFKEGSTAEQFLIWGVLQQVLQPLLLPFTAELQKLVLSATPVIPMSPTDAAAATARGFIDKGTGQDKANDSGIGSHDFDILTNLAQHAPDLSVVFELYRRGIIGQGNPHPGEVSVRGALTDAGIPADWHGAVTQLATAVPDQSQVLTAWLTGQIPAGEARQLLEQAGMDPKWVQTAYNAEGQAPTPTQLLELWNRGIIPEGGTGAGAVSYEQGFLEGPWRNKWLAAFKALREYLPPPRTITAMFHAGQLSHAKAAELLDKQGLDPELVQAYLAKSSKTVHPTEHLLTKTELTQAYADGLMSRADATKALEALHYTPHDAALVLELIDVRVKTSQLNSGVTRVRSLYEQGKLTDAQARSLLHDLGLATAQAAAVVQTWSLTQAHKTRALTPAQIESAWYYELIDTGSALSLLQAAGYDDFDAWVALSVRNKGPLKDVPRPSSPFPPPKRNPPPATTGA